MTRRRSATSKLAHTWFLALPLLLPASELHDDDCGHDVMIHSPRPRRRTALAGQRDRRIGVAFYGRHFAVPGERIFRNTRAARQSGLWGAQPRADSGGPRRLSLRSAPSDASQLNRLLRSSELRKWNNGRD